MMSNFSFFHLAIFLLFISSSISPSPVVETNLIEETCKKCSESDPNVKFDFCMKSLQAAPASQCASLRGLGSISINLVRYNVTDTRCHIKQLLKSKEWDQYYLQILNDCIELYSDSVDAVKRAMKSYNDERFDDANVQISAVMDCSTTCEDGFKEGLNNLTSCSPLSKRNEDLFELGATSLCLLMMIQKGSSD